VTGSDLAGTGGRPDRRRRHGATLYFVSGPAAGIVAATLGSAMVLFAVAALVAFLPAHPRVAAAQRVGRAGGGP